jgi:hypothetical protein
MGPSLQTHELSAWCKSRGLSAADEAQLRAVFEERDLYSATAICTCGHAPSDHITFEGVTWCEAEYGHCNCERFRLWVQPSEFEPPPPPESAPPKAFGPLALVKP